MFDVENVPSGGSMDINAALQEAAKALDKRQAHLCVLASNYDEPVYTKLVEALCAEHQINLIKVDNNKTLGEWAGLCKIDT
ncbi:RPS12 [Cordylochernes scorpioides]|uniref:40S ribosomal protein S12 n=1 Tax=Cordylochernes scorpioides TaxID=51811 RepID=A0ABY6K363_9ARAC|nr:RPS12 [Cordylochernes scorpioides]